MVEILRLKQAARLLALEFGAFWELGAVLSAWPLLARAPKRDKHSVVVSPGLSTSCRSTVRRRRYLDFLGYQTNGWRAGSVTPPCRHQPAASSGLASPPHDEPLGRVQLRFLG